MDELKKYVGTKAIKAKPMTRGAYNDLRGWTVPENENPADDGYLVVYPNGEPNVEGYDGYVSWSPKKQFKEVYRVSETFKDRLVIEQEELNEKINKLTAFMESEQFESLSVDMKAEMQCQRDAMSDYLDCLSNRLELLSIGL